MAQSPKSQHSSAVNKWFLAIDYLINFKIIKNDKYSVLEKILSDETVTTKIHNKVLSHISELNPSFTNNLSIKSSTFLEKYIIVQNVYNEYRYVRIDFDKIIRTDFVKVTITSSKLDDPIVYENQYEFDYKKLDELILSIKK